MCSHFKIFEYWKCILHILNNGGLNIRFIWKNDQKMIFDALKSKCWNVLATNISIFNTFYSTRLISKSENLLLLWFFLSRFGFNHLEISKCPNISEFFQLTRTPEVSLRLINNCSVYVIYFWSPCTLVLTLAYIFLSWTWMLLQDTNMF